VLKYFSNVLTKMKSTGKSQKPILKEASFALYNKYINLKIRNKLKKI